MFTSRAEFRLSLRADNADQRLTPLGEQIGCVGQERSIRFRSKQEALGRARHLLEGLTLTPSAAAAQGLAVNQDGIRRNGFELLSRPDIDWQQLVRVWPVLANIDSRIAEQVAIDAHYAVYLERQARDAETHRRDEALSLEPDMDYAAIPGLSRELQVKLKAARPSTLGQAARLEGMTPAAVTLLAIWVRRQEALRAA